MLMYSWPFSPSSWIHFLFQNNTIHNDQAFWVLKKSSYQSFYHENDRYCKIKRGEVNQMSITSITRYLTATSYFFMLWREMWWTFVGNCHPLCQTQTAEPAPWDCGAACWVYSSNVACCKWPRRGFVSCFIVLEGDNKFKLKNKPLILLVITLNENIHLQTTGVHTAA